MEVERGLITTVSEFTDFLSTLGSMSHGAFSPSSPSAIVLTGSDDSPILIKYTYSTPTGDRHLQNPGISVVYNTYETPLLGSNEAAISLAYEIRASASGDTLVKFAQWITDEPMDIIKESFQAWGIAAYTAQTPAISTDPTTGTKYARFLDFHRLRGRDLLGGQNYGGFLVHEQASGDYAITVFSRATIAPIYTWAPGCHFCAEGDNVYVNLGASFASYTERKRRVYSLVTSSYDGVNVLTQEPYNRPKRPTYAVLAPIFAFSTGGDYSKTSRWIMQSPHMYNPFDSDGYVLINGGDDGSFYSDHGVCLSAKGDKIASTGETIPALNTWLHNQIGDFERTDSEQYDTGIYGLTTLDLKGEIYDSGD